MSKSNDLGFPVKGSLTKTPFPSIVRCLADSGTTGSLYLLNGKTKKVVFFEDGVPVFVRSNVLSECLGQRLAAEGLISQEQCDQTLEAIRRTGKKQGELLVEMGILSEGNLRYGLLSQLRFKLFDIFTWPEGKYQFKPGSSGQDFGLRMDYSPGATIAAAVLEGYDDDRARTALADRLERFPQAATNEARDLELLPEERHLFEGLDGSRSIAELIDGEAAQSVPRPATLVLALVESGLAEVLDVPAPPRERGALEDDPDKARPDDDFAPTIEHSDVLTEYEDTPLPGKLPSRSVDMSDEDEAMFAGVEDSRVTELPSGPSDELISHLRDGESSQEVPAELLAAEFGEAEEVFDDDEIELVDDDALVLDDDVELEPTDASLEVADALLDAAALDAEPDDDLLLDGDDDLLLDGDAALEPIEADPIEADDALMDLDDLDDIDLGGAAPVADAAAEEVDPEVEGAMQFSSGEAAVQAGDWETAVGHLEAAYESGVDVAELHAHLAYARFNTAPHDPGMCDHALELLEYAEGLNPNLDLIYAYRGAVFQAQGDLDGARGSLEQALSVNPYCDLALELMDRL